MGVARADVRPDRLVLQKIRPHLRRELSELYDKSTHRFLCIDTSDTREVVTDSVQECSQMAVTGEVEREEIRAGSSEEIICVVHFASVPHVVGRGRSGDDMS